MVARQSLPQAIEVMYQRSVHNYETDCWLWQGSKNHNGYGKINVEGRYERTHRVAFKHFSCDPGKLNVLHTCDEPSCWNPNHLWLGTHKDNMDDRETKGRTPKGEGITKSKLTAEQVLTIRASSLSCSALAKQYDVAYQTIRAILFRFTWKHI